MEDSATLQKDLNSLTQWMETWLLKLNIGKCKAISYSRRPELNTKYSISGVTVENIENMKDLGVTFDNKLKFDKHINKNSASAEVADLARAV